MTINIYELASNAVGLITVLENESAWIDFLTKSSSYYYKLSSVNQALVYIQKRDATAVFDMGRWNRLFHHHIGKRKRTSIKVIDVKERSLPQKIFDISDTTAGDDAISIPYIRVKNTNRIASTT